MKDPYGLPNEQIERQRPVFSKNHGEPRVGVRHVLREIIFVNGNGLRWRDAPRE